MENGADSDLLGRDDYSSKEVVAWFGTVELVKVFIEFDVDVQNEWGIFGNF